MTITNSHNDHQICKDFAGACRSLVVSVPEVLIKRGSPLHLLCRMLSTLACKLEDAQPRQAIIWIEGQQAHSLRAYREEVIVYEDGHRRFEGASRENLRDAATCRLFLRELRRYHVACTAPTLNAMVAVEQRRAREDACTPFRKTG